MSVLSAFLALGSINPTTLAFTELSGSGYARQPIDFVLAGAGEVTNEAALLFPAITGASWSRYNAYAVFDALTAGNRLMMWNVKPPELNSLSPGRRQSIAKGNIRLSFPVVQANSGSPVIMSGPYALAPQALFLTPAIKVLSQAAYDAIATPDASTVYMIEEEA